MNNHYQAAWGRHRDLPPVMPLPSRESRAQAVRRQTEASEGPSRPPTPILMEPAPAMDHYAYPILVPPMYAYGFQTLIPSHLDISNNLFDAELPHTPTSSLEYIPVRHDGWPTSNPVPVNEATRRRRRQSVYPMNDRSASHQYIEPAPESNRPFPNGASPMPSPSRCSTPSPTVSNFQGPYPMDIQADRPIVTSPPRRTITSTPGRQPDPIYTSMSPPTSSRQQPVQNDVPPPTPTSVGQQQSSNALDRFVTAGTRHYTLHYVVTRPQPHTETTIPRSPNSIDQAVQTEPNLTTGTLHYRITDVTPAENCQPVSNFMVQPMSNPPSPTLTSCFAPCLSAFHRQSNSYSICQQRRRPHHHTWVKHQLHQIINHATLQCLIRPYMRRPPRATNKLPLRLVAAPVRRFTS